MPSKATSNVGLDPVSVGESVAKFKSVLSVSETSVQPEIATPEEFLTVSFAAVKVPVPALVNLNDSHCRIGCELASHPILGTMDVPEKDAVVGARDEQPCVCVLMLRVLIIGPE